MSTINIKLCGTAVSECDTSAFEQFAQSFHAALVGSAFVPLGGMHDGGADGFEENIYESASRTGFFLQASKSVDIPGKIRRTVRRLRAFGREPNVVLFYFSEPIATIDKIEEDLSIELNVTVRIRGKQFVEAHINNSPQTIEAYNSFLKPAIMHLLAVGTAGATRQFPFEAKTLCAFLGQEISRRRGNASVLTVITDSLILWSLEGTDPVKKIYMNQNQIQAKIEEAIPVAKQFIKGTLQTRLAALSNKANDAGRQINYHRREDAYVLQHEQRQKLHDDNAEEAEIITKVSDFVTLHLRSQLPDKLHNRLHDVTAIVMRCVEQIFYTQGLEISVFIRDRSGSFNDEIQLTDSINSGTDALDVDVNDKSLIREAVRSCMRKIIFAPDEATNEYLIRLSNTYFLLFALKNEPRVVEYFSGMAQQLVLYVGSDLIIKSISEYHLPEHGQLVTNALKLLQRSGATLIMSGPAYEEVYTHMRAAVLEFENYYATIEPQIGLDFVAYIDRILIRAYFYAVHQVNTVGKTPRGWKSYINQFCDYKDILSGKNRDGLKRYLCDRYGFEYEPRETMRRSVDRALTKKLAERLAEERRSKKRSDERALELAANDALHALRIFSRRQQLNEANVSNPFGHRAWWLTHEKVVQRVAVPVIGADKPRFIMRPEFLLNYISLVPSKKEIMESFKTVFPSMLGVSLSRRAPPAMLHAVLNSAREAFDVDNSRAKVMLQEFVDKLKSDQIRIYDHNLDDREPGTLPGTEL